MGMLSSKERWAYLIGPLREELSGAMASSPTQLSHPGFWAVGFMALHKPVMHPQLAVDYGLEGFLRIMLVHLTWDGSLCASLSLPWLCVCPFCHKGFSKRRFDLRMQLWTSFSITLDWCTNLLSFLSYMWSISHPRVVLECGIEICTRWNVSGYCHSVENGIWVIGAWLEGVWRAPKISVLLLGWFCLVDLFLLPLLLAAAEAKNRPMIFSCFQETAVSSGTWPPSRSQFADGSSCLLLKPESEWYLQKHCLTDLTQPSCCLILC